MSSYGLLDDDGFARTDGGMPVREECPGECCDGGGVPCFYRFDGCPVTGECAVSAPPVYIPCDAVCGDGSPAADRVITIDSTDYAGWCWRRVDDCRYTEGPDIPPGWCELPQDAVVVEDGIGCVADCDDGACSRRGTYLIPDLCEGVCGPEDRNILVCPSPDVDLSRCYFTHAGVTGGYCACIVVGPHSREFEGDPTGYRIERINTTDQQWREAIDPQAACCECCAATSCQGGALCNYRRILPPQNSKQPPFCFSAYHPDGVVCCCGKKWTTVQVAFGYSSYDQRRHYGDNRTHTLVANGWSMLANTIDADGTQECISAHARITEFERVTEDGQVTFEDYRVWSADSCDDVTTTHTMEGCRIDGRDMSYIVATSPIGSAQGVWLQCEQMLSSYASASGFWSGATGTCSGSADVLDCDGQGVECSGQYAFRGSCHHGSAVASLNQLYGSQDTETIEQKTRYQAVAYSIITSQHNHCGGGCGGKVPRKERDLGNAASRAFGKLAAMAGRDGGDGESMMLGAGDIL